MLDWTRFTKRYKARKITDSDVKEVFALCRGNELLYKYCPPFVTEENIRKDMKALPRGKSEQDKYYLGFFDENILIAVLDLIDAYPDKDTAFIGFFMMNALVQKKGIGTQLIEDLCRYLKSENYKYIRLGWAEGNDQSKVFWHKNGFLETGVRYDAGSYTVIVAQRCL